MNKNAIIHQICEHYLELPEDCKADLYSLSAIQEIERGERFVKEGQFATDTYFIASGCARAFYLKDGKDITDWFAFENDFICSLNSFFLNLASAHFIEAIEPCVFFVLSKEHNELLAEKYRAFDRLGKLVVTKTMLQLQQRIVSVQFETAQQKYDNLIRIRPDITLRMPLMHIASYLGITLETLSRIRNPKNRI